MLHFGVKLWYYGKIKWPIALVFVTLRWSLWHYTGLCDIALSSVALLCVTLICADVCDTLLLSRSSVLFMSAAVRVAMWFLPVGWQCGHRVDQHSVIFTRQSVCELSWCTVMLPCHVPWMTCRTSRLSVPYESTLVKCDIYSLLYLAVRLVHYEDLSSHWLQLIIKLD